MIFNLLILVIIVVFGSIIRIPFYNENVYSLQTKGAAGDDSRKGLKERRSRLQLGGIARSGSARQVAGQVDSKVEAEGRTTTHRAWGKSFQRRGRRFSSSVIALADRGAMYV